MIKVDDGLSCTKEDYYHIVSTESASVLFSRGLSESKRRTLLVYIIVFISPVRIN